MSTHIYIGIRKRSDNREHSRRHDDNKQIPGWSAERTPKDEPKARSLTAGAGSDQWAQRAAKHSFGSNEARSPEQITNIAKQRARIRTR